MAFNEHRAYELMCRDYGVVPQSFVSGNGNPSCPQRSASLVLVLVPIHQNGNAERAIQTT
jgi:hypothetical protein